MSVDSDSVLMVEMARGRKGPLLSKETITVKKAVGERGTIKNPH